MTKKQQNRTRSFGARSLSVVMAVLIALSTLAVALTASTLGAGAAASHWVITGDFADPNNWKPENTNTEFWVNGASGGSTGSATIQLPEGNSYASMKFKVVWKTDTGYNWYGSDTTSISGNQTAMLKKDAGNDITYSFVSGAKSLTFTVTSSGGNFYVGVTPNYDSVDPDPEDPIDPSLTEKVGVNPNNSDNSKSAIQWVEATYFDYLSDKELTAGWLYPDKVGTGHNGSLDEWYPFYNFNRDVVKSVADSHSGWSKPLYFGNFCNTYNAYDTRDGGVKKPHHIGISGTTGYADATNSYNVTRFNYAANNSNGVYDRFTSVQGLVANTLTSDKKLQTPDGTVAPYFDEASLGNKAKVIKSSFPFRKEEKTADNGSKYMRYEFNSNNATDNVYFTWETKNGETVPKYVNYGAGTTYGVRDGLNHFMNENSGYGIFPFNNASANYKGTKTKTNENLDYGFGIRMDMKFRVPADTAVTFDFTGDDDLWMYITDESTQESQLVLDMGGSHKKSTGRVDFLNGVATVDKVDDPSMSNSDFWVQDWSNWGNVVVWAWDNNNNGEWYEGEMYDNLYRFRDNEIGSAGHPLSSKTKFLFAKNKSYEGQSSDFSISSVKGKVIYSDTKNTGTISGYTVSGHCKSVPNYFNFDPKHTYTMTIFYMERGLIESNCEMGFTMTPLGNNFIVTEEIAPADVNKGLLDDVLELSQFGFVPKDSGNELSEDTGYHDFTLGNGGKTDIPETALKMKSKPSIEQYAPKNSYLIYDSSWKYYDNISHKLLAKGSGITSNGITTNTVEETLIAPTNDEYDFAELQVDYKNTPRTASFSVTKTVVDDDPDADHSQETFPATVLLQFASDMAPKAYDLYDRTGTVKLADKGNITLKDGQTITFGGIPEGTRVYVGEDPSVYEEYDVTYSHGGNVPFVVGTDSIFGIVNTVKEPDPIYGDITGTKMFDGSNYTGTLFRFKLDGVTLGDEIEGSRIYDTGDVHLVTNQVTNGVFKLGDKDGDDEDNKLKFAKAGIYRYHVYEDMTSLTEAGAHYDSDIYNFNTDYLVTIEVKKTTEDGKKVLKVDSIHYVPYSKYEDMVALPGAGSDTPPVPHVMVPADFYPNKTAGATQTLVFENTSQKGIVNVEKTNQKGDAVEGVVFAVLAITDDLATQLNSMSDIDAYNLIKQKIDEGSTDITVAGSDLTERTTLQDDNGNDYETGYVQIGDLPIYKPGYTNSYGTSTNPQYQQYCLIEYSGPASYSINKTVYPEGSHTFTFPMQDSKTGMWQYHCTYKYVNAKLKVPSTAGSGMVIFKLIGLGIAAMSVLVMGGYVVYILRRDKRKTAKHFVK